MASRVGISQRKLLKVCKPEYFSKITVQKLYAFAEVFNIPVANLFQTFLIKDEDRSHIIIEQQSSKNELYCLTKIAHS
ncbi:MAG: hypothetical protein IPO21_15125 [Bacteroidales bacterium]|nr:hypothetical protein [Bacteroidales bacterium]